jgi:hypothetical protein
MPSDPRRQRWLLAGVLGLLATATIIPLGSWALAPLPPLPTPLAVLPEAPSAAPAQLSAAPEPALWRLRLWQPLRDAPPPAPPTPAPPRLACTLFSISEIGGLRKAGLDVGEVGLVFLAEGASAAGVTVHTIGTGSVEIEIAGRRQTLELSR